MESFFVPTEVFGLGFAESGSWTYGPILPLRYEAPCLLDMAPYETICVHHTVSTARYWVFLLVR